MFDQLSDRLSSLDRDASFVIKEYYVEEPGGDVISKSSKEEILMTLKFENLRQVDMKVKVEYPHESDIEYVIVFRSTTDTVSIVGTFEHGACFDETIFGNVTNTESLRSHFPLAWTMSKRSRFIREIIQTALTRPFPFASDEMVLGQYHVRIPMGFDRYANAVAYPNQLVQYIQPEIIPHNAASIRMAEEEVRLDKQYWVPGDLPAGEQKVVPYDKLLASMLHVKRLDMRIVLAFYGITQTSLYDDEEIHELFDKTLPNYYWSHLIKNKSGLPLGNRDEIEETMRKMNASAEDLFA